MSDEDPDPEADREPDPEAHSEADGEDHGEDQDLPEIEDDERADLSVVADQIQTQADEEMEDDQDEGDSSDESEESDSGDSDADTEGEGSAMFGDAYVTIMTEGVSAAVEARGGDPDPEAYREQAERVGMGEAFDRVAEKRLQSAEMSPEQQLMVSTLTFAGLILAQDTDIVSEVVENAA